MATESARLLREARRRAGMSQTELARRAGTSQATISAYESGRKRPSAETLSRLLAAAGYALALRRARSGQVPASEAQLRRAGRELMEVLELAEALPSRPGQVLRFPRLETVEGSRP